MFGFFRLTVWLQLRLCRSIVIIKCSLDKIGPSIIPNLIDTITSKEEEELGTIP
jgi:hypothetical protein